MVALGDGFLAIDLPDTPWARAASMKPHVPPQTIVERETALWVHGASSVQPQPLHLCVPARGALRAARAAPSPASLVREVVLCQADVVELSGVRVTTPVRTAIEIARTRTQFTESLARAVGWMLRSHRVEFTDVQSLLDRRPNLTHRRRALTRLGEALSLVDRSDL